jgi:hypothetical protein
VTGSNDAHDELLKKFQATIAGADLADLRTIADQMMAAADVLETCRYG